MKKEMKNSTIAWITVVEVIILGGLFIYLGPVGGGDVDLSGLFIFLILGIISFLVGLISPSLIGNSGERIKTGILSNVGIMIMGLIYGLFFVGGETSSRVILGGVILLTVLAAGLLGSVINVIQSKIIKGAKNK